MLERIRQFVVLNRVSCAGRTGTKDLDRGRKAQHVALTHGSEGFELASV